MYPLYHTFLLSLVPKLPTILSNVTFLLLIKIGSIQSTRLASALTSSMSFSATRMSSFCCKDFLECFSAIGICDIPFFYIQQHENQSIKYKVVLTNKSKNQSHHIPPTMG
eukprot:TRINITY_DN31308_c0_g1_i1.p1 TRINITY_DN31308_c0_g1~~TRINITY_DN31308_c0_g1_i1.p1  ORF type:complete len:110 (+),score=11.64 TRINITY_DN31308_c0_g1_i1:33-362(+)